MTFTVSRRGLLAATGAMALTACAHRPATAPLCSQLDPQWKGVALVSDGAERQSLVQGLIYPNGPRITEATRFNILSLGKMMTGVLIGQLVDEGRLRYDDLASRHLPELPSRIGDLPVGVLLNHTSGLVDHLQAENFAAIAAARSVTDLLPLVLAAQHNERGPVAYSNGGYMVAGAIIERLTGLPYAQALDRGVFTPCRMRSASLSPRDEDALPEAAHEALRAGHAHVGALPGGPAGGAFMTADDIVRFAQTLRSGNLVSAATLETITTIQAERQPLAADGVRRGWGFGFNITGDGATRGFGHTGGLPGAGAALRMAHGSTRIVVALANQDRAQAGALSSDLMMRRGQCAA